MADISKKLNSRFLPAHRYANFGACVNSMKVNGFRGISCGIHFEFPVTAITGLNGAGKSTIGQLLLCAYKRVSTAEYKRFYVKDFFPVSVADPEPFIQNASVEYQYQTSNAKEPQVLTVSRAQKEWSGYKRQPEKASIYIGLAFYLPKVERRDLTIYGAKNITLGARAEVEDGAMWASRILGNSYEEIFFQEVQTKSRKAELGMATRLGARYSENNMGFGEGRVVHTIRLLESCPPQSLIVLEEPETSLHEFAQYEFAKYLMDVSFRRGHQIVFSSHSSSMIRALPTQGRKMLSRDQNGVSTFDRLSSIHLRNALTEGQDGHLIICVEDKFAERLLIEIIRLRDHNLLKRVKVLPFGDAIAVKGAVEVLHKSGTKAIGVRDGDQPENPQKSMFRLPGETAPEKLVFLSPEGLAELNDSYSFDLQQHLIAHPNTNHHNYGEIAAKQTGTAVEIVEADCIRSFIRAQSSDWGKELVKQISDSC